MTSCSTRPFRYDASFYRSLDRVVQTEPWLDRDRAMIDQLATIGIEKGKAFNPIRRRPALLDQAAREAHALLEQRYDAGFPVQSGYPLVPGRGGGDGEGVEHWLSPIRMSIRSICVA